MSDNTTLPGTGDVIASKDISGIKFQKVIPSDSAGAEILIATQATSAAILAKLSADPATQTTAADILAKISADPATATLQTSANTKLDQLHMDLATTLAAYVDGLEALIGTTNTGLTTLNGNVDGLETLGAAEATLIGAATETAPATDTASSGLNGRLQRIAQRLTTLIAAVGTQVFGAGTAAAAQRTTLASDDPAVATLGITTGAKVITDANGTIQQYARGLVTFFANALGAGTAAAAHRVVLSTDQTWPTGMSPRAFLVAFATLTRPANTTAYAAGDSISDNATAGSVTALVSGNISDTNDDPLTIIDIIVKSTDTGLAGKKVRAYLFNADPTASSGVSGGDNAAYSQKINGYIGSFTGWLETGFSDGTVGRLVPLFNETNLSQAGGFIVAKPASGAKTLWVQYQAVDGFTPSANSTTIIGTIRGFQGRAT